MKKKILRKRKSSKSSLDLSEDETNFLSSYNHNNKFNNNNIVAKIKINQYGHMDGGKKQNIEDSKAFNDIVKILNTNNNIHHNNIFAKIEINNYNINNSPEKKGENNGFNYNIYNKKSQISKGNDYLPKLNNSKIFNVFYNKKEENLKKNESKKKLLLNYNLEEKEEKEEKENLNKYQYSRNRFKRGRSLLKMHYRKKIFSEAGKSILDNNKSNSLFKKNKTELKLKINNDSDNDNSIKSSNHDSYEDDNSKDDQNFVELEDKACQTDFYEGDYSKDNDKDDNSKNNG